MNAVLHLPVAPAMFHAVLPDGRRRMAEHVELTRRDVLIGAAGGLALAAVDAGPALAQARRDRVRASCSRTATGRARRAPPIPGLPGVLVSNGRDVAVTGADGRYTLPLPDEATIFVVKPAGFMPPLDPLDQPAALLPPPSAAGLAGVARPAVRGDRADRPAARLARFPADAPGRAEGVRRRAGHRPAARDRGGGRLHPRGPDPGARRTPTPNSASPPAT